MYIGTVYYNTHPVYLAERYRRSAETVFYSIRKRRYDKSQNLVRTVFGEIISQKSIFRKQRLTAFLFLTLPFYLFARSSLVYRLRLFASQHSP